VKTSINDGFNSRSAPSDMNGNVANKWRRHSAATKQHDKRAAFFRLLPGCGMLLAPGDANDMLPTISRALCYVCTMAVTGKYNETKQRAAGVLSSPSRLTPTRLCTGYMPGATLPHRCVTNAARLRCCATRFHNGKLRALCRMYLSCR